MSNCIKGLYNYELVDKCCSCGIISLKSKFHKRSLYKDGLDKHFNVCRKDFYNETFVKIKNYYLDNGDKISVRHKEYQLKNHDKIFARKKIYSNNRLKTDINFRLICRTRSRVR